MAAKPETTFYTGVHKHLTDLYFEKMANPYRGGTFDCWYSGRRDLWVEYKFIELPKRDTTVIDLCTPRGKAMGSPLSALQQQWGADRWAEGRNVWVIVGVGLGRAAQGIVLNCPAAWERTHFTVGEVRPLLQTRRQIADEIATFTSGGP